MQLVVGGCSFSSFFRIPKECTYGALISKELKIPFVDQARIQGSNYRIWRTIGNEIIKGIIKPNDLIIIQYTEIHRQEIWSPVPPSINDPFVDEPYDQGKIFKWKYGADQYAQGIEKSIARSLMRFSNENFDKERFELYHQMFCALLQNYGFKKVYFLATTYCPQIDTTYPIIDCRHMLKSYHQDNDPWHMSTEGHSETAKLIMKSITLDFF